MSQSKHVSFNIRKPLNVRALYSSYVGRIMITVLGYFIMSNSKTFVHINTVALTKQGSSLKCQRFKCSSASPFQ